MEHLLFSAIITCFLLIYFTSSCSASPYQISGIWTCDDGGTYYIRQIGDAVFWYGENSSANPAWSNVANGKIYGNIIQLEWADVPKGKTMSSGHAVLKVHYDQLIAVNKTGEFVGSIWDRAY